MDLMPRHMSRGMQTHRKSIVLHIAEHPRSIEHKEAKEQNEEEDFHDVEVLGMLPEKH